MDLSIIIKEIEEEINNLNRSKNQLLQRVQVVELEINSAFSNIKGCPSVKDTDKYFKLLEELHGVLAKISYIAEIKISNRLNRFVYEFERIDDLITRERLFQEIKSGKWEC